MRLSGPRHREPQRAVEHGRRAPYTTTGPRATRRSSASPRTTSVHWCTAARARAGDVRVQPADDRAAPVPEGLDALGLDDEARALFLGGTAERVFGLTSGG
jgi:hypothetical protein